MRSKLTKTTLIAVTAVLTAAITPWTSIASASISPEPLTSVPPVVSYWDGVFDAGDWQAIDAGVQSGELTRHPDVWVPTGDPSTAAAQACGVVSFGPYFSGPPGSITPKGVYGLVYVGCPDPVDLLVANADLQFYYDIDYYKAWLTPYTHGNSSTNSYNVSASPEGPCIASLPQKWRLQVQVNGIDNFSAAAYSHTSSAVTSRC